MRRFLIYASMMVFFLAVPMSMSAKSKKTPPVDLSNMHSIFVGWVDLNPSAYASLSYASKDDWIAVINKANADFQAQCQSKFLAGRTIVGAKDKDDEITEGNDLYIKFDDVVFDSSYILHISAHLIDLKTNQEVATITDARFRGRICTLEGCVTKELNELGSDLQALVEPDAKKK
jgi:hypothetical protein